jgi:hypothetical protein
MVECAHQRKKMLYLNFFSIDSKAFSKTELPMQYHLESVDMPDKKKNEESEREKPALPTSR